MTRISDRNAATYVWYHVRYCRRIPLLADAKIVRTWGGWLDDSYDGVPVISKIDEMDASDFKNLFENLYNYEK